MTAHAGDRLVGVVSAGAHMAHQIEHARIIEMHADHHQVELLLRQQALRLSHRAREHHIVPGKDGGQSAVAVGRIRNEDALWHVGDALIAHSCYAPRACPFMHDR